MEDHCGHSHCCESHVCDSNIMAKELVAHLPYGIFSVAFALVILSFISFFTMTQQNMFLYARVPNIIS